MQAHTSSMQYSSTTQTKKNSSQQAESVPGSSTSTNTGTANHPTVDRYANFTGFKGKWKGLIM
eukprot:SAG11_NODE_3026_length_2754_cov_2.113371_4_plen_63_part_00